jgi:polyhydroxybutyrate depolymerase
MSIPYALLFIFLAAIVLTALYRHYFGQQFLKLPELKGEYMTKSLTINKMVRRYSYYLPPGLDHKVKIVFMLHGAQDTGSIFRKRLGYDMDILSEEYKFIPIYPDGYKKSWNDCRLAARYPAKRTNIDDLLFLLSIRDDIAKNHDLMVSSVFIFGYSNGGQLANRICLERPEFISGAAIAAANLPTEDNMDCINRHISVPIVFLSGTNDHTNPYNGGLVNILNIKKMGHVKSTDATINYWQKLADCNSHSKQNLASSLLRRNQTLVEKKTWRKENKDLLVQYIIHGGGHTIPHKTLSFPRILGPTNHDISFSKEAWHFFNQL